MRRRAIHTCPQPPVGPFRIVITAIRRDTVTAADTANLDWYAAESARDEQRLPELVILTIPLLPIVDKAHAVERAARVSAELHRCMGRRFLEAHRVKVVPAGAR